LISVSDGFGEVSSKQNHRLFSTQKAVDVKRCASDQSIADLLKKKMVAYDLIAEISFRHGLRAVAKTICPIMRLVNRFFVL